MKTLVILILISTISIFSFNGTAPTLADTLTEYKYKAEMNFQKDGFAVITNGKNIFIKLGLEIFPKDSQRIDYPMTGFPATEADWILPDENLPYSIFTLWSKADYSILYNDLYLSAKADSAWGLTLDPDNKVSMTGCLGEHELIVAADEFNVSYTLSGNNHGNFSLFINKNGEAVVEGDVAGNKLLCEPEDSNNGGYEIVLEKEGTYSITDFPATPIGLQCLTKEDF